jgi:hypothetical protein
VDTATVAAVSALCQGSGGIPRAVALSAAEFQRLLASPQTFRAPVPQILGLDLRLHRVSNPLPLRSRQPRAALDNQFVTWIMIDPVSGFAPFDWQGGFVGDCIAFRGDGQPLTVAQWAGLNDLMSSVLDMFGEGSPPTFALNGRADFTNKALRRAMGER